MMKSSSKVVSGLACFGVCVAFLVACSGSDGPQPDTGANENNQTSTGANSDPNKKAADGKTGEKGSTTTPPTAGDGKTTTTAPGNPQTPGTPGNQTPGGNNQNPGQNGEDGQAGRVSVNEHCCFNGKYQRCPNANACLGGFDLNACLQNCSPFDPCFDECFDKLDNAGPPKGCDANAAPPPGVDCANGQINI